MDFSRGTDKSLMSNEWKFDKLVTQEGFSGPVEHSAIRLAEKQLGLVFPAQYKKFLLNYGASAIGEFYIFGLPADPDPGTTPLWESVVSVNRNPRIDQRYKLFLDISHDGGDVSICLNAEIAPETEIWSLGPGVERVVSKDFFEFFVGLAEGTADIY